MKNYEKPTEFEITQSFTKILKSNIDELVAECDEFCENSYEAGREQGDEDGYKRGIEDAFDNEREIERLNTNYVVEQFADCVSLEDFQNKLKEITSRSYNFM